MLQTRIDNAGYTTITITSDNAKIEGYFVPSYTHGVSNEDFINAMRAIIARGFNEELTTYEEWEALLVDACENVIRLMLQAGYKEEDREQMIHYLFNTFYNDACTMILESLIKLHEAFVEQRIFNFTVISSYVPIILNNKQKINEWFNR